MTHQGEQYLGQKLMTLFSSLNAICIHVWELYWVVSPS